MVMMMMMMMMMTMTIFFFSQDQPNERSSETSLRLRAWDAEPTSLPSRSLGFHFHSRARRSVEKVSEQTRATSNRLRIRVSSNTHYKPNRPGSLLQHIPKCISKLMVFLLGFMTEREKAASFFLSLLLINFDCNIRISIPYTAYWIIKSVWVPCVKIDYPLLTKDVVDVFFSNYL